MADPPPKSREFNEIDVERLHEVVITLHKPHPSLLYAVRISTTLRHIGHDYFLKDSERKVVTMAELLRFPTFRGSRLEDVPPKTRLMEYAEHPCKKVHAEKEKKRQKAVEKATTKAGQEACAPVKAKKAARNRHAGKGGASYPKKKKVRQETPSTIDMSSGHISSPVPLNHSKPFDTLDDIPYAFGGASASRLDENVVNEDAERNAADENDVHHVAGGDNTGGGSSPHLGSRERDVRSTDNIDKAESNEIKVALPEEDYVDLHHAHESCKDVKLRYNGCKKELTKLQAEYQDKVAARDLLLKDYEGEMVTHQIVREWLPTFVRRLHQSHEYKQSLGDVFSLAIASGWLRCVFVSWSEEAVRAILADTKNINPAAAATFMESYDALFDKKKANLVTC
nr:hypothetical protein [Tanacetum cinerariifolium]